MDDQTSTVPSPAPPATPPAADPPPRVGRLIRIATRVVLVLVILSAGVGVFGLLMATGQATPRNPPGANARRVVAFELEPTTVRRPWRGYGTAEAVDSADVPARVTATVAELPTRLRSGVRVEAGQVLARLDASDFERALHTAEQQLADLRAQLERLDVEAARLTRQVALETEDVSIMQREVERVERLRASNAAQVKDLDDSRRALITAESQLVRTTESLDALPTRRRSLEAQIAAQEAIVRQDRANLERTTIVSPIDGVLEAVDLEVGEQVTAGSRVARVVALSKMEVGLALPASARGSVAVGDRAVLTSVGEGQQWLGEIGRVNPRDDEASRTVTVYVDVEQPGADARFGTRDGAGLLTPGVFVSGWAAGDELDGCWVVPRRSVRDGRVMVVDGVDDGGAGVVRSLAVDVAFTLSGESVPGVRESTGLGDAEWVVVTGRDAALTEGLMVLVTPPSDVRDGSSVEPVTPGAATRARAEGTEP